MRHVSRWSALAALVLVLLAVAPPDARAEVVAGPVEATARTASVVATSAAVLTYARSGEGLIAMTTRICGSSATWTQVAAANRVYGPAYVIYLGRAYTVTCTRVTATATTTARAVAPVVGRCVSGYRTASRPRHNGIDIPRPYGTPIRAVMAGRVKLVAWQYRAGHYIVVDHGSVNTVYDHMNRRSFLPVGRWVTRGQTIGYVGATGNATGPHLHFEVQVDPMWQWSSYRNPVPWLRARGVAVYGC